jgi:hypothetical protein
MPGETSYDDKPYVFIPLVKQPTLRRGDSRQGILRQGYSGQLEVTIEAVTPLHFGAGKLDYDERQHRFVNKLLREEGKIVLSGSAFKGMLRSVFEAVTESCILTSPKALSQARPKQNRSTCKAGGNICPACSVFGCLGRKGKLNFTSFAAEGEKIEFLKMPNLQSPFRDYPQKGDFAVARGEGNERLYYGSFEDVHGADVARLSKVEFFKKKEEGQNREIRFYGRKFYKHSSEYKVVSEKAGRDLFECLKVGSRLVGTVTYQGLTYDEFGALLFALGLGWKNQIFHKIGYAKPAYYGSVLLRVSCKSLPKRYKPIGVSGAQGEGTWFYSDNSSDLNELACQYYNSHAANIEPAVTALLAVWSDIGTDCWSHIGDNGVLGY